jgi:Zn-dependent protease/CBS domain-containing protein
MPGSLRIGRVAGIDIYINVSWLIILVLLTFSLAADWFPTTYPGQSFSIYLVLGFIATLLLFVSVLLHELAHSLVARRRGLAVKNIVLFVFGGVSNIEQEPRSAGVEFQMAFVGPLTSLLIGAISYGLFLLVGRGPGPLAATLSYLAIANLFLGVFNLLPGFPLDGGRVLRSVVWKITGSATRATRIATVVGQIVAFLFILYGIWLFFNGAAFSGIWLGFIGWFMLSAAQAARTQVALEETFHGVTAAQVMKPDPMTVPANISLQKLVDEYFLPQGLRSALVMQGNQLAGLISLSDIRHVPRDQWPQTPVGFSMTPIERLQIASPQQSLKEILPMMISRDINQLPVVQDGRLVGVLSRDAIIRTLEVRRRLGLENTERM